MATKTLAEKRAVDSKMFRTADWDFDFDSQEVADSLAVNVAEARMAAGISQTELGKIIGHTPASISSIERAIKPRLETVLRIAIALGLTPNDLLKKRAKRAHIDLRKKVAE